MLLVAEGRIIRDLRDLRRLGQRGRRRERRGCEAGMSRTRRPGWWCRLSCCGVLFAAATHSRCHRERRRSWCPWKSRLVAVLRRLCRLVMSVTILFDSRNFVQCFLYVRGGWSFIIAVIGPAAKPVSWVEHPCFLGDGLTRSCVIHGTSTFFIPETMRTALRPGFRLKSWPILIVPPRNSRRGILRELLNAGVPWAEPGNKSRSFAWFRLSRTVPRVPASFQSVISSSMPSPIISVPREPGIDVRRKLAPGTLVGRSNGDVTPSRVHVRWKLSLPPKCSKDCSHGAEKRGFWTSTNSKSHPRTKRTRADDNVLRCLGMSFRAVFFSTSWTTLVKTRVSSQDRWGEASTEINMYPSEYHGCTRHVSNATRRQIFLRNG